MRAVTWQGPRHVEARDVPDPVLVEDTDAIVQVSATAICGSDLHLYEVLAPYLARGDILGHEAMGTVVEVGRAVERVRPGDRVVIPFNIACGRCWMCARGLQSQCEVTQVREHGKGAALFGYTALYGRVPGSQAEYVRVPHADAGLIPVPPDGPDERWLYLSDILPTAWQAARYAEVGPGDTVAVVGLGPVGHLAARCAQVQGAERVIGIDRVPERVSRAAALGVEVVGDTDDTVAAVRELTGGRGADKVIEAVGMEAHGAPVAAGLVGAVSRLPKPVAVPLAEHASVDRLAALRAAFGSARRGGTVSIVGVYGGAVDPINMMELFDRQLTLRMGQANVRRWSDELQQMIETDADAFGTEHLATHRLPLEEAARGYDLFQRKADGCLKVVLYPGGPPTT